ncbi:MAG: ruvC [Hydrocarboniphaga sp.]|uniref:crossover junction endodeoxyribonuclease RuvC n=1 Tax=Hydrocarboniphaga sp. TaxID=2033016 RepID=UPI002617140E|nr:crossover junction endodeoxyribonuclease RuvC [Hydrocarboniphaga sp.]MDB5971805.1 ruvC [Hydrocarboniphaga sp.]
MATPTVRILGIDPGSRTTGWGVIDSSGYKSLHIAHGCLAVGAGELPERLLKILRGLSELIGEYRPEEVAIEETFVNRANPQSALVLGQARGAAICAIAGAGVPMAEYAAAQVKMAIVGNGRADKDQVQHMVKVLLNLQQKLATDASDALAVALTHAHVRGTRVRAGIALSKSWG